MDYKQFRRLVRSGAPRNALLQARHNLQQPLTGVDPSTVTANEIIRTNPILANFAV